MMGICDEGGMVATPVMGMSDKGGVVATPLMGIRGNGSNGARRAIGHPAIGGRVSAVVLSGPGARFRFAGQPTPTTPTTSQPPSVAVP